MKASLAGNAKGRSFTPPQHIFDFYARPSAMTDAGPHASTLRDLRGGIGELVCIIQGLGLYDVVA